MYIVHTWAEGYDSVCSVFRICILLLYVIIRTIQVYSTMSIYYKYTITL